MLELHTFYGDAIPPYAILSHTWLRDDEEVTFEEIKSRQAVLGAPSLVPHPENLWIAKPGAQKIKFLCDKAA